jgi:hypothetical protein
MQTFRHPQRLVDHAFERKLVFHAAPSTCGQAQGQRTIGQQSLDLPGYGLGLIGGQQSSDAIFDDLEQSPDAARQNRRARGHRQQNRGA